MSYSRLPKQNTPEWLEWRKGKIGASDAPIIMGESPWRTPYQLWRDKLGLDAPQEQTEAMRRGHELEPIARAKFEEVTGIFVEPVTTEHQSYHWMMASLDGLSICGKVMVEIKCPCNRSHEIAKSGIVPDIYRAQLQHQLAVNPGSMLYYFSFTDDDYALIEVAPDEIYQEELIKKELEFWNMVQEMTPPALTDRDYQIRSDGEWIRAVNSYLLAKQTLDVSAEREKKCKEHLVEIAQSLSTKGCGVTLSKYTRMGSVDYSAIPEIKSVDLAHYRKAPTECWRVTRDNSIFKRRD